MGRPRKYSDQQIIDALAKERGMVYRAAALLGCDARTIHRRANENPDVAGAIEAERGKVIDLAEQKLHEAIERSEPWAVQLALKTIGRNRGYVEKQELETTSTSRLVIEEEIVGGDDNPPGEAPQSAG